MKKIINIILVIFFILNMFVSCSNIEKEDENLQLITLNYNEIKDKLIRFHVIANSDSVEDQNVKLLVRDAIIDSLNNELAAAKDINEAREILAANIDKVNETAEQVLLENGFQYGVATSLSKENFPDKVYGDCIFPQGNYEAYRIVLGNGKGHNWWCVMFPTLCFVDETKNNVNSEAIEKKLENSTNNMDSGTKSDNSTKKVKLKFKIVEIAKELFGEE